MSFREKSAWVCLAGILIVYGFYFVDIGFRIDPNYPVKEFVNKQISLLIGIIITLVIGYGITNSFSKKPVDELEDERDKLISAQAGDIAGGILGAGTIASVASMYYGVTQVEMANWILLALVVSELVNNGYKIAKYRHWI